MPNLPSIPLYQALDAYEVLVDNLPLNGIQTNFDLLNNDVDSNTVILETAQGTAGDLNGRLNTSLNADGTLITSAIDNALHSIEDHTDGSTYVRMKLTEQTKLSTITASATDISFKVDTMSVPVTISNGIIEIDQSDTVEWTYTSGKFKANVIYDPVQHYYNVAPYTVNNLDFITTSGNAPFISGSLRIYVNGVRIPEYPDYVYVPTNLETSLEWVSFSFTETNSSLGTFSLNTAIDGTDLIQIDFDQALV